MEIPIQILDSWKKLRSHGDGKKIVKANSGKIGEIDITRAFKNGKCSDDVFEIIGNFYKEKEQRVEKYMPVVEDKEEGPDG